MSMTVWEWFEQRSYHHRDFEGLGRSGGNGAERPSTTLIFPARNVAGTIGTILSVVHDLRTRTGLPDQVIVIRQVKCIHLVFAFAHFAIAIQAQDFYQFTTVIKGMWFRQCIAIAVVESLGKIPGHFQVLFLVFTHRHFGSPVNNDIRCLQYRVGKQTCVYIFRV